MMPTRRPILRSVLLIFGLLVPAAGHTQSAQQATAFIRQVGDQLVAIANGPGSVAQRQAQLGTVLERAVDVDGVARFSLGRFWRIATPEQQREYLQLFHHVMDVSIGGHLGEYRGVSFTINHTAAAEGGMAVDTTVSRPNAAPADVQWIVQDIDGQPKIVDVIAEGTSMRLTQRSDYASYLSRNGNSIPALIDALRRQASAQAG